MLSGAAPKRQSLLQNNNSEQLLELPHKIKDMHRSLEDVGALQQSDRTPGVKFSSIVQIEQSAEAHQL
jgi:hypothetical protein